MSQNLSILYKKFVAKICKNVQVVHSKTSVFAVKVTSRCQNYGKKGENIFKRKEERLEGRYIKDRRNGKAVYGYVFGKSYMESKTKKAEAM